MKTILMALFLAVSTITVYSSTSQAAPGWITPGHGGRPPRFEDPRDRRDDRWRNPRGDRRGSVTCEANDNGWEEHGSHRDCRECLSRHGSCTETCSKRYSTAVATGLDRRGTVSFNGEGYDRRDAEDDALRQCRRYASACRIESGSSRDVNKTISRRSCR